VRSASVGGGPGGDEPPLALVDTHAHLDARQFAGEPTVAILGRAAAAGVTRVVSIGVDLATSRRAVALAEAHPGLWATVGVSPNDLAGFDDTVMAQLAALAAHPRVVAVGEIGLDYHWNRSPRAVQRQALLAQLDLAHPLDRPVVIHSRDAREDTTELLLAWASAAGAPARPLGVMHCFSGDRALAEELHAAGFLISLAGVVTYPGARALSEVAAALPDEALLLETDAPYLPPQSYRGRRNEPAYVRATAEHVAALRGTSLAQLAAVTSANAARLFRWNGRTV